MLGKIETPKGVLKLECNNFAHGPFYSETGLI